MLAAHALFTMHEKKKQRLLSGLSIELVMVIVDSKFTPKFLNQTLFIERQTIIDCTDMEE